MFRDKERPGATMAVTLVVIALLLGGCGDKEARQNVRPPKPGVPTKPSDVQGIYRSIRPGLLQLRGDGEFVLIISDDTGASAGTYTLDRGDLTVRTDDCGPAVGRYRVDVGGRPVAGEATLSFTAVSDECVPRLRSLTGNPWVYADS